ncbi:hypothetical protein CHS0354_009359 [Potamilus streckersoni]|uniref:Uncharacterized protein n=1 Tax=Potamilus streckersoni TaxID=2493646 RepID=A0AAE0TFX3_9BIVA|nr:hypothetical protein CHS0354_009359 [Potamilus streckersoni]
MAHMCALSAAINMPVRSYYPPQFHSEIVKGEYGHMKRKYIPMDPQPESNSCCGPQVLYLAKIRYVVLERSYLVRGRGINQSVCDKPQSIYKKLKKKYDEVIRPTGIQQVNDKKKYEKSKGHTTGHIKTVADHIQQLENMITLSHSFVRTLTRTNGETPSILLLDDEQLTDINNIYCTGQTVLGVDKT